MEDRSVENAEESQEDKFVTFNFHFVMNMNQKNKNMINSKTLLDGYNSFEKLVNETFNAQVSRCLGKRVLENDEDIEDCSDYLTFVDDLTGENIDFRFVGIDADGVVIGAREDNVLFEAGTLRINNINLRSKIEIIKLLEGI